MHADLLLRLNAIAMNPLPFWLKILETFLLYCRGYCSFSLGLSLDSDGFCPFAILLRVLV